MAASRDALSEMNDISDANDFPLRFSSFIVPQLFTQITESSSQSTTRRLPSMILPAQPQNQFVPAATLTLKRLVHRCYCDISDRVSILDLVLYNIICHLLELLRPIIQPPETVFRCGL